MTSQIPPFTFFVSLSQPRSISSSLLYVKRGTISVSSSHISPSMSAQSTTEVLILSFSKQSAVPNASPCTPSRHPLSAPGNHYRPIIRAPHRSGGTVRRARGPNWSLSAGLTLKTSNRGCDSCLCGRISRIIFTNLTSISKPQESRPP